MKILVIGGGLSGSILRHLFRKSNVTITCWEKSRGVGGRAATKRGTLPGSQADTGLQVFRRIKLVSSGF